MRFPDLLPSQHLHMVFIPESFWTPSFWRFWTFISLVWLIQFWLLVILSLASSLLQRDWAESFKLGSPGNQPLSLGTSQKSPQTQTQVWLKEACYE